MIARVVVVPKPVVNDPQGVTVRQGLNALGFAEVTDVRVGKYIEVSVGGESAEEVHARVDQMCRRLLANQVIEDYRFDLLDTPTSPSPSEGEGPGGGAE
ncbi:MAG TPA: phosphoribosylformylglycinamidine synthase subunit PurS [Candidatus Dormibacteraeota bacterium]|nr:phosphoribosylformylglycinamidine synthase subunit PurS [Candidatus Dormibacteraeota bacterium]